MVFGATGYTGRLTAERLVAAGRPVRCSPGRSEEKLRALAARLGGLGWEVADVAPPRRRCSISSQPRRRAGLHGRAVRALGRAGACAPRSPPAPRLPGLDGRAAVHPPRVHRVRRAGPRASGATLLTAMGYDFVPGRAGRRARAARGGRGRASASTSATTRSAAGRARCRAGTRASIAGIALAPSFAFRGGARAHRALGRADALLRREGQDRGRPSPSAAPSTSRVPPVFDAPARGQRLPRLVRPAARSGITATSRVTAIAGRVPGLRHALIAGAGKLAAMGDAPAEGTTPGGLSWIAAAAYDAAGEQLAEVHLSGADGYDFTAGMLAWAARRIAAHAPAGHRRHRPARGVRARRARARRRRGGHHARARVGGAGTTKGRRSLAGPPVGLEPRAARVTSCGA